MSDGCSRPKQPKITSFKRAGVSDLEERDMSSTDASEYCEEEPSILIAPSRAYVFEGWENIT